MKIIQNIFWISIAKNGLAKVDIYKAYLPTRLTTNVWMNDSPANTWNKFVLRLRRRRRYRGNYCPTFSVDRRRSSNRDQPLSDA